LDTQIDPFYKVSGAILWL